MQVVNTLLKRLLWLPLNLFLVSLLGFFLMRYHLQIGPIEVPLPWGKAQTLHILDKIELRQPIDPLAEMRQNPQISPQALAKETERLALDQPWLIQYSHWILGFLHGDLGQNNRGESVAWLLSKAAGYTLLLNLCVLSVTWCVGIPLGIWAAVGRGGFFDQVMAFLTSVSLSTPAFILALVLGVKIVETGLLPYGGIASPQAFEWPWWRQWTDVAGHLVLPTVVLAFGGVFSMQRLMRANLLEVLSQTYVFSARSRGVLEWKVVWKHAVRNALNPLVTILGFEFAGLFGGAILVETVLGYPGIGLQMYQAAMAGDANMVMASLVLSSVMLVLGNAVADALLVVLDPRLAK
ncbi:MAG: ABC transporter permease [Vampirovibrio sp.]|jgi:peptide/nickel transport system permease protein